jgi:hypothetical protein
MRRAMTAMEMRNAFFMTVWCDSGRLGRVVGNPKLSPQCFALGDRAVRNGDEGPP